MTDKQKAYAIILASGIGDRFEGSLPKQFCIIAGKPVLMHTIAAFASCPLDLDIILVLHTAYIDFWKQLVKQHNFRIPHKIVMGGKERFHSAKNALEIISDDDDAIIGIHDGVRPFVSNDVILRTYSEAASSGAVIPVLSTVNPVRLFKDKKSIALDCTYNRSDIHIVQTPQVFKYGILKEAFKQEYHESFKDDSIVVQNIGKEIQTVEGNRENIKITFPLDMILAEAIYSKMFANKKKQTDECLRY